MRIKIIVFGLFALLMVCVMPVAAITAVDDNYVSGFGGCFARGSGEMHKDFWDLTSNDIIPSDVTVTAEVTQQPQHGYATFQTNPTYLKFEYGDGFTGTDTFRYRLFDGTTYSNEATVTVNILNHRDSSPSNKYVYQADYYISKDTSLPKALICPEGMIWRCGVSGVSHRTLTQTSTVDPSVEGKMLQYDYTPNPGFTGIDQFTFQEIEDSIIDGLCKSSPKTITIHVATPVPEFPSAFLPVTMVIGFLGVVLFIRRTRDR
jgi:large repetitive protein